METRGGHPCGVNGQVPESRQESREGNLGADKRAGRETEVVQVLRLEALADQWLSGRVETLGVNMVDFCRFILSIPSLQWCSFVFTVTALVASLSISVSHYHVLPCSGGHQPQIQIGLVSCCQAQLVLVGGKDRILMVDGIV